MSIASALSIPEIIQQMTKVGCPDAPISLPTVASATSIDLTAVPPSDVYSITGTTDIANIKPPFTGFRGTVRFCFAGGTPPDFVSGGTPGTGEFAVALTKSMAQYEIVSLTLLNITGTPLWYPAMT